MKVIYNDNYKKLFAQAQAALIEAKVPPHTGAEIIINSLASYYEYLDELVQSCSPEFIRNLPYNEQYFTIDTNTRSITMPTDLGSADGGPKWVIGVKDDHQAEILWFSVDRFYDDVDLAICFPNLDEIGQDTNGAGQTYIQWKNKEIQGLDEVTYVQITEDETEEGLESNKIYFGWVLQGDSTTAKTRPLDVSGDLTFSVRFQYHQGVRENGRPDLTSPVLFSFNTLPVTCTIYPNLTEQMSSVKGLEDLKVEDVSSQGIMRPRFSGIYDNTKGPKPLIDEDLPNYIDLDENNQVILDVSATASGQIKYQWYKDGAQILGATEDTYTANAVGSYKVHIGNEYKSGSTRWVESNTCEIPAPSEIKYTLDLPEHGFADQSSILGTLTVEVETLPDDWSRQTGTVHYTWYRKPLGVADYQPTLEDGSTLQVIEHDSATYTPDLDKPGIYYVEAVNNYNNAETKPLVSNPTIMKARATKPNSVTYSYDEITNIITAIVDIEFKNDLYYRWTNETTGASTSWIKDGKEYQPSTNGMYYCQVAQVVYMDTSIQDGDLNTYTPMVDRVSVTRFKV